jgi:hypothetical protein
MGHFFYQQYFCARVVGGDGRYTAGGAKADNDDIAFFVPSDFLFPNGHAGDLRLRTFFSAVILGLRGI